MSETKEQIEAKICTLETKEQIEARLLGEQEVRGLDAEMEDAEMFTLICKSNPGITFTRPRKLILARMKFIETAVSGDANHVSQLMVDIDPDTLKRIMDFFDIETKIPDFAPPSAPMQAVTVRELYKNEKKEHFMPVEDFYDNFGKDIKDCTNKPFHLFLEGCDYLNYHNGLYSGCAHYAECIKGNEEEEAMKMLEPDHPLIQIPSME